MSAQNAEVINLQTMKFVQLDQAFRDSLTFRIRNLQL